MRIPMVLHQHTITLLLHLPLTPICLHLTHFFSLSGIGIVVIDDDVESNGAIGILNSNGNDLTSLAASPGTHGPACAITTCVGYYYGYCIPMMLLHLLGPSLWYVHHNTTPCASHHGYILVLTALCVGFQLGFLIFVSASK
jgi:hypothetical protein